MLKCCNNVGEKQYSQSRTCFFSLCWLFNYIGVGRACIYGALAECEPVQLKRLQANTQSHKAVPLGPRHPSTRLLMTAVRLPWREGPAASHWHMPGKSSWGWCATETRFQRKLVRGAQKITCPSFIPQPTILAYDACGLTLSLWSILLVILKRQTRQLPPPRK